MVYLVTKTDVSTSVQFVVSKTRVAPLQTQTIPHLELVSALLLSRLVVSVSNSLQSTLSQLRVQCYTDSQIALYSTTPNIVVINEEIELLLLDLEVSLTHQMLLSTPGPQHLSMG